MSNQSARYIWAALAALAGLALIIAAVVLLTREDDREPVRIVAPQPAEEPTASQVIKVQVSGEVLLPGVYRVEEGDRVIDAVVAAGGISPNADLSSVNLSRRVQDEAHYHIPAVGGSDTGTSPGSSAATPGSGGLIDLNTATTSELEILPEIGPSLAAAIVSYRNENGPFDSVEALDNVPGIGPKTLEAIRQFVTVSGRP